MKTKRHAPKRKPKHTTGRHVACQQRPCSQFWVIDTAITGSSEGTLQASGPFHSQARAEQWIKETATNDWLGSCGCLRHGAPEDWGSEHIIAQVVRSVKPVPPSSVKMTLVDTANALHELPPPKA
jgi:hypothetical protein